MIILNKSEEYIEYIPVDCIRYISKEANGKYAIGFEGGVSITLDTLSEEVLGRFINCGNGYYVAKDYIVLVTINKERNNGAISVSGGREIEVADITVVQNIIKDFITVFSADSQRCTAINPIHVLNVVNPLVRQKIEVSMPGGLAKVNIDAISNQVVFVKIRLSSGAVFDYSGSDALQVLKYYENSLNSLVAETPSSTTTTTVETTTTKTKEKLK